MSRIRAMAGDRFEHAGQSYFIAVLATDHDWTLIGNHITASGAVKATGHRAHLPVPLSGGDLCAEIERIEQRIKDGDAPDEPLEADEPNTAFDL